MLLIYSATFVSIILTSSIKIRDEDDTSTSSAALDRSEDALHPNRLQAANDHPATGQKQENWMDEMKLCFVTSEFSETVDEADRLPVLDTTMIRNPPRHFLFTNLPSLAAVAGDGWNKIVLRNLPYRRVITQSRWPKFLAWQHPELQKQECQVIFYLDAYLCNPINETAWQQMAKIIVHSPVGLMQAKQIGSNNKPVKGPIVELKKNARMGKVSWATANATIEWLRNQRQYRGRIGQIPVYKNAIFGYEPGNQKFRSMVQDFWQEYSKESGSWRDQSYWAYFLFKHDMRPLKFPFSPPVGPKGERGHNGHIYVKPLDPNKNNA